VIARWPTGRCVQEDLPELHQTRGGLRGFLEQQHPTSSSAEPFDGATRPDTFTFHSGNGRGVVWRDDRRGVLWLCSVGDRHDPAYDHARALASDGRLYPQLDAAYDVDGRCATVPWGECPDEDLLEALRFTGGATETFGRLRGPDQDPAEFDNGIGWIRLGAEADVWTMTIRRNLVYPDPASPRTRWLTNAELERVFVELTGQDPQDAQFWAPPHDAFHINIHFIGSPLRPDDWLSQRIAALLAGETHPALRLT
jgi:hypothetical protein